MKFELPRGEAGIPSHSKGSAPANTAAKHVASQGSSGASGTATLRSADTHASFKGSPKSGPQSGMPKFPGEKPSPR